MAAEVKGEGNLPLPVNVGFRTVEILKFITRPANTTAYAADDAISDTSADNLYNFNNAARSPGGSGTIDKCVIVDSADAATRPDLELWLFNTPPAKTTDNSAWAVSDTELNFLTGIIVLPAGDFKRGAASGNLAQMQANLGIPFVCRPSSTSLYGQLVVRNAYTPASGEIFTITLSISQD